MTAAAVQAQAAGSAELLAADRRTLERDQRKAEAEVRGLAG